MRYLRELEEKNEARAEGREEGREEGLIQGREEGLLEGRQEARENKKSVIRKKLAKGKTLEEITDDLEESTEEIRILMKEIAEEDA